MNNNSDITTLEDIKLLVDSFYGKIREDALLAPIFYAVIQDHWPAHLEKMYRFWQTILLEEYTYSGSPFPPHAKLSVNKTHFDQWLHLWSVTIDENFSGTLATEAKWRAEKMATMFLSKIEYYKNNNSIPLI
jgi:hemoglobin